MRLVKSSSAIKRNNSDLCKVTEYHIGDKEIDFAIVELSGRYPDVGLVTNQVSKEIVYIQQGQGKIVVDGVEWGLEAGDAVLVDAEEKFFWEGNMVLHIVCTPPFTVEQHMHLAA